MSSPKPAPPLGQAVDKFLATLKEAETRKSRANALNPLVAQFGAIMPLWELDAADIADWMQDTWGALSTGTWNNRAAAIRAAYRFWADRRWISSDDLGDALGAIRNVRSRATLAAETLTPQEMQALLRQPSPTAPTGIRNRAIITMLYRSGLRLGELIALRPADLDHKNRSIRLLDTKTGQAQTRFWHETADESLKRWIDTRRNAGINGHHPLFCTLEGAPLSQSYVRDMLKRYARKAGIVKRVHPHGFRHTFAVELEAEGVRDDVISKLLGHASRVTTALYLRKLSNADAGKALAAVDMPGGTGPASEDLRDQVARLEETVRQLLERKEERT